MGGRGIPAALLLSLALLAAACVDSDASETLAEGELNSESRDGADANGADTDGADPATGDAEDGQSGGTTSSTTSPPVETTTATAGNAVGAELVVLDAGAEPRSELRVAVPDGTTQVLVAEQFQSLSQTVDGQPLQNIESAIVTRTEVTATVTDGGYRVSSVILSAEAGPDTDPAVAAAVDQQLGSMVGIETTGEMDDRGNVLSLPGVTGTEGLDPALADLAEAGSQLSAPLPDEPVGIGASWSVTQKIGILGIETEQTTTYTITDIAGSVVTIATSGTQTVDLGGTIDQGGVTVEVVGWESTSEGTLTLDLTSIVPTSSSTTRSTQEFAMAGTAETLQQTVEIQVDIRPE